MILIPSHKNKKMYVTQTFFSFQKYFNMVQIDVTEIIVLFFIWVFNTIIIIKRTLKLVDKYIIINPQNTEGILPCVCTLRLHHRLLCDRERKTGLTAWDFSHRPSSPSLFSLNACDCAKSQKCFCVWRIKWLKGRTEENRRHWFTPLPADSSRQIWKRDEC